MSESSVSIAETAADLYITACARHQEEKDCAERQYWQGRKEALRTLLSLLEPEDRAWQQLQDTSYEGRHDDLEILRNQVSQADALLSEFMAVLNKRQEVKGLLPDNIEQFLRWTRQTALHLKVDLSNSPEWWRR